MLMLDGIELKVGMKLRTKKDAHDRLRKGDVREIERIDFNLNRIFFTNGKNCGIDFAKENYEVVQEAKFKIGDSVIANGEYDVEFDNAKGVVKDVSGTFCKVEFEEPFDGGHDCSGYCKDGCGYFMPDVMLALVEEDKNTTEPKPMNRPEAWLWLLGQKEGAMCKNNNDYIKLTDNDLRFCDNTGKILDVCLAIMSKSEQWLPYTPPQEITLQEAMDIWKNEGRVMVVGQRFSVVYSYFDYIECQSLHDAKFYKVEGER